MARRIAGQPETYAWIVNRQGWIRSIPIRGGVTNKYVENDANTTTHISTQDRGQLGWRIHSKWRDVSLPPVALVDAYKQDKRAKVSKLVKVDKADYPEVPLYWWSREGHSLPFGYTIYMRYAEDAEAGRVEKVEQDPNAPGRTTGRNKRGIYVPGDVKSKTSSGRTVPKPFPLQNYPSLAYERITGKAAPSFEMPDFGEHK